jgi:hypothetical protein
MERRTVYLVILSPEALEELIRQVEAEEHARRLEANGRADDGR